MNITEFLKLEWSTARIDCGASWMFWEPLEQEWVVMNRKYGKKKAKTLYRGASESDAINALLKEEKE